MIDELINSELFSVKNMKYRVGWTGKPSNCKNRENFGYFKKWNTSGRFKWQNSCYFSTGVLETQRTNRYVNGRLRGLDPDVHDCLCFIVRHAEREHGLGKNPIQDDDYT